MTAIAVSTAILLLIPTSFAFTVRFFADRSMQRFKKPVVYPPPDIFPLLVLTPSATDAVPDPHIVYYKDLQSFLEKNPRAAFTIPDGSENELNSKLDPAQPKPFRLCGLVVCSVQGSETGFGPPTVRS